MNFSGKIARSLSAITLAAAGLAPALAAAQADVRNSSIPSYHLVQISVERSTIALGEFEAQTKEIRSCEDASALARSLGADFKRNRRVRANELPDELRSLLEDLPIGHATPVVGSDETTMRVLVICNRR